MHHEITRITGLVIRNIPADGKLRTFKVGNREWYAIYFGDCGSFGCFSTGELYGWTAPRVTHGEGVESNPANRGVTAGHHAIRSPAWKINITRERKPKRMPLRDAQAIATIGARMFDQGQPPEGTELDQYIEALGVVMDSKLQAQKRETGDA